MNCILALPWQAIGLLLLAGLALAVVIYGFGWCDGRDSMLRQLKAATDEAYSVQKERTTK